MTNAEMLEAKDLLEWWTVKGANAEHHEDGWYICGGYGPTPIDALRDAREKDKMRSDLSSDI